MVAVLFQMSRVNFVFLQVRVVLESVGDGVCAVTPTWDMGLLTLLFSERFLVSLACLSLTVVCLFVGEYLERTWNPSLPLADRSD